MKRPHVSKGRCILILLTFLLTLAVLYLQMVDANFVVTKSRNLFLKGQTDICKLLRKAK